MEIYGHVMPNDALDSHKCYVIDGDDLYLLLAVEGALTRAGEHELSKHLHNLVRYALDNELKEDEE